MDASKFGLTLFDILSYLLPGLVVLFGLSVAEATFFKTSFLCLQTLGNSLLFSTVAAYFFGQICHIVGSLLKEFLTPKTAPGERSDNQKTHQGLKQTIYRLTFENKRGGLSDQLYAKFKTLLFETYNITGEEGKNINVLERYLLADSFVVAAGGGDERASLLVREGFCKSTMVASAFLFIIGVLSLPFSGLALQVSTESERSGILITLVFIIFFGLTALLFGNRFNYYNRTKMNNTYLLFLAYIEKNNVKTNNQ